MLLGYVILNWYGLEERISHPSSMEYDLNALTMGSTAAVVKTRKEKRIGFNKRCSKLSCVQTQRGEFYFKLSLLNIIACCTCLVSLYI